MHRHTRTAIGFSAAILSLAAIVFLSGCASREDRIARAISKADEARQRNETSIALTILGKAALKTPDSPTLQEALGNTFLEANDPQSAVKSFEKAIELDSNRDRLWVSVAELYTRLGEELLALESLGKYLDNFPDDFLAWKNYAAMQENRGELNAAIESNLEWNRIRPSAAPALKIGLLFQRMGNLPQARSWISQAAAYSEDAQARDALAALIELEIQLQQYLPASTWLDEYDKRYGGDLLDPRVHSSRNTIERWRNAQREIAEAAAELERRRKELEQQALEARLEEEKARLEQNASIAMQTEDVQRPAEPDLTDDPALTTDDALDSGEIADKQPVALIEDPQELALPVVDFLSQARSAAANLDFVTAIDLYWRALGSQSENPDLWHELAGVYEDTRNWLDAEACILEAKRRAPMSSTIAGRYLEIISRTQAASHVIREAEALMNLFPENPTIALILARTLRGTSASRARVARAYEAFLHRAGSDAAGVDEANAYLGR